MSTTLALEHAYRYRHASRFDPATHRLQLATYTSVEQGSPYFYVGDLRRPRQASQLLRTLFRVVQSRFHVPAAMLGRILAQADPVVTCHPEQLRWEGFSACCGVYVRVDWLAEALRGEVIGCGTTNVDFHAPLLATLASVRDSDRLTVSIGDEQVELAKNAETVVEKRVALPIRWLKGFVEVQACLARMELRHEISGLEASRFLRSLPRMKTNRRESFVVAAGRGLRISQVAQPRAVRVGGLERLRTLEDLAAEADQLRIYADDLTGASAWELEFPDSRLQLAVSPETWRGFSGEGQSLTNLASAAWREALPRVRAELKWQARIRPEEFARRFALPLDAMRGALAALGSQGLVGFDVGSGEYFHRELPFDLARIERLHPRLEAARRLIAEGRVARCDARRDAGSPPNTNVFLEYWIRSSDVEHRVLLDDERSKCTCPWFSKHGLARGPCKHILAAQITLEETHDE